MSYTGGLAQRPPYIENATPAAGPETVKEMLSENLQYRNPNVVENMQSRGLQYHMSSNFHGGTPQYADNMQSGGLQYHDPYIPQDQSDEELPPPVEVEKIDPPVELSAAMNQENGPSTKRRTCGLPRRTFWLLAAILALIIIGAVVGGVVAGIEKSRSNSATDSTGTSSFLARSSTSANIVAASTVTVVLSSSASVATPITLTNSTAMTSTGSLGSKTSNTPEPATPATTSAAAPNTVTVVSAPGTSPNVVASSAAQVSATPTDVAVTPARANPGNVDGNYFVHCHNSSQVSSGMAYYKNLNPGSNVGQVPDDYIDVVHGSYVTWENGGFVTFHTGIVVHWAFYSNPVSGANERVGTADNTFENFYVYRDAGELLYSTDGWSCYSQYWAF